MRVILSANCCGFSNEITLKMKQKKKIFKINENNTIAGFEKFRPKNI